MPGPRWCLGAPDRGPSPGGYLQCGSPAADISHVRPVPSAPAPIGRATVRPAAHPASDRHRSRDATALLLRAPAALFVVDVRGRCTFVNERFCELTGLTADSAKGDGWLRIVHPDDRDSLFEAVRAALAAGAPI